MMERVQLSHMEGRLQELLACGTNLQAVINILPPSSLTKECRRRLQKVLKREMNFLCHLERGTLEPTAARLSSTNLIHLEAVINTLQHPLVSGATAVMQRFSYSAKALETSVTPSQANAAILFESSASSLPSFPAEALNISARSFHDNDPTVPTQASSNWQSFTTLQGPEGGACADDSVISDMSKSPKCEDKNSMASHSTAHEISPSGHAHIDVVCMFDSRPAWLIVTSRKAPSLHYEGKGCLKTKPVRTRVQQLLAAAAKRKLGSRPEHLLLWFAEGLQEDIQTRLASDFGAQRLVKSSHMMAQPLRSGTQTMCSESVGESEEGHPTIHTPDSDVFDFVDLDDDWVLLNLRVLGLGNNNYDTSCTRFAANQGSAGETEEGSMDDKRDWTRGAWFTIPVPDSGASAAKLPSSLDHAANASLVVSCTTAMPSFTAAAGSRGGGSSASSEELPQEAGGLHSKDVAAPCISGSLFEKNASADMRLHIQKQEGSESVTVQPVHSKGMTQPAGLVNLDTTALVAIVSEISNGGALALAARGKEEMQRRFRTTWKFMADQVESELERPLLPELEAVLAGRQAIVCESVRQEFNNIVAMIGGSREKKRAEAVLSRIWSVPDHPSARVLALAETGRIKARHKIMAGTADTWHAPTLTANMAFVRAAQQAGLPLAIVEHRARALTGD